MTGQDSGANRVRWIAQSVTGNWKIRCKLLASANSDPGSASGLVVAAGTSGTANIQTLDLLMDTSQTYIAVNRWADYDTPSDTPASFDEYHERVVYLEMEYDGTNIIHRISSSGVPGTFIQVHSEAVASQLGTPTHYGIYNRNNGTTPDSIAAFDWFRRIA